MVARKLAAPALEAEKIVIATKRAAATCNNL
jgi:hypothetical protein